MTTHQVETSAGSAGHLAGPGCSPCYSPDPLSLDKKCHHYRYSKLKIYGRKTAAKTECDTIYNVNRGHGIVWLLLSWYLCGTWLLFQYMLGDVEKPRPHLTAYLVRQQSSFTNGHPPQSCHIHRTPAQSLRDLRSLPLPSGVPVWDIKHEVKLDTLWWLLSLRHN